jgi:hypothetical protein
LYWFLAILTNLRSGYNEYYDDEDEEKSFSLYQTLLSNGKPVDFRLDHIEKEDILAANYNYEDRTADSEDEGGFTGNENMPAEYRYHDRVMIMI